MHGIGFIGRQKEMESNYLECDGKMYDDGEEIACKVCGFVVEEKQNEQITTSD